MNQPTKPTKNIKVIPIHQAKTNLSQLVREAQAGETIYIGAYGQPQAIIAPIPVKKPVIFGSAATNPEWQGIDYDQLDQVDEEIIDMFENSGADLDDILSSDR